MVTISGLHNRSSLTVDLDGLVEQFGERAGLLGVDVQRVPSSPAAVQVIARLAGEIGATEAAISTELMGRAPGFTTSLANNGIALMIPDSPEMARDALLGVTTALHPIAETGSVLTSEATLADRSVAMLSLNCVFVIQTDAMIVSLDEAGQILRSLALGPTGAYSTMITGPSRTADIEMSLTVGVQGPARVLVVLVDSLT